ncbi:MAG: hypothetical protein GX811_06435 [Lentisphaerae bacterium]|jgi:hypothetical protein|nr:hypothetical protein [Lentisphaerota bacterium]
MPDFDWNIKSRSNACSGCDRPFEANQVCVSRLIFTKDGYERSDNCEACWSSVDVEGNHLSYWRGTYQPPPPPPEEPLKKETAESILRKLIEQNDPARINSIFVLAVMLERKRILIEKAVHNNGDGLKRRVYEHKNTGETFAVLDPDLNLAQMGHVQHEVSDLLNTGLL